MKHILTAALLMFGPSAFSQEIPNVWKYKGMDTIRYSIPLMKKRGKEERPGISIMPQYRQGQPFVIIPEDPYNTRVYRMPVVVPPTVTVGLIPNPALDPEYMKNVIAK